MPQPSWTSLGAHQERGRRANCWVTSPTALCTAPHEMPPSTCFSAGGGKGPGGFGRLYLSYVNSKVFASLRSLLPSSGQCPRAAGSVSLRGHQVHPGAGVWQKAQLTPSSAWPWRKVTPEHLPGWGLESPLLAPRGQALSWVPAWFGTSLLPGSEGESRPPD